MKLTEQDVAEWRHHPVTRVLFEYLESEIADKERKWLAFSFDGGGVSTDPMKFEETLVQQRAYLVGKVEQCEDILDIKLHDIQEKEQEDDEQDSQPLGT